MQDRVERTRLSVLSTDRFIEDSTPDGVLFVFLVRS